MEETLKAWRDKILISMIPVVFAASTFYLFGNSLVEALGEAYSTYLYFAVVLAVEIDTIFTLRPDPKKPVSRAGSAPQLLVIGILWVLFVVLRISVGNSPSSTQYPIILVGGLGFFVSIWIMVVHLRKTRLQYIPQADLPKDIEKNEDKELDRIKKPPSKPTARGKKLDARK